MAKTRLQDIRSHDLRVGRGYDRIEIPRSLALRLLLENVGVENPGNNALKAALHSITDDLLSKMRALEKPRGRAEVLQSVCRVLLTMRRYLTIFTELLQAGEDESDSLPKQDQSQDISTSSFIVTLVFPYTEVQEGFQWSNLDPHFYTRYFGIPLEVACQIGNCGVVKAFLASGADINRQSSPLRFTALKAAAQYGQFDVVQLLLKPTYRMRISSSTVGEAVCLAIQARHLTIGRMILATKPKVDRPTYKRICLWAARHGYEELVLKMLDAGADQSRINYEGTPLSGAAENGHCSIVSLLLDRGGNVRQLGHDAFVYAAGGGHVEVLDMMLKRGVDMQADNRMLHAFVVAAERGSITVAEYLLKSGLEINTPETKRWRHSALYRAMGKDRVEMVRWLFLKLDMCPSGDSVISDGDEKGQMYKTPPMMDALQLGKPRMVTLLSELGAKPIDLNDKSISDKFPSRFSPNLRRREKEAFQIHHQLQ